ncbi:hypothetical protein ACFV3E_36695 [Streptomyces sp. NPDC059718]
MPGDVEPRPEGQEHDAMPVPGAGGAPRFEGEDNGGRGALETAGNALAVVGSVLVEGVRYTVLLTQLTAASVALRGLSETVRSAYQYVEACGEQVNGIADLAAQLDVDELTTGEHRDAATMMRTVLEDAEAMASEVEEMSTLFQETADAHAAEYGPVVDSKHRMPVDMANRIFYSNNR